MAELGSIGGTLLLGAWAVGQNSYSANAGQILALAMGSRAGGQNTYTANTGKVIGKDLGAWAVNLINPLVRKPNRGYCSFMLKDVVGGTAIAGARCFIFERSSMISLPQNMSSSGPTPHVSDSNGFVKFTNLEAASDVYYLVMALHPTTGFNAARFDYVQAVLEV